MDPIRIVCPIQLILLMDRTQSKNVVVLGAIDLQQNNNAKY
jgi:hypothetical protein